MQAVLGMVMIAIATTNAVVPTTTSNVVSTGDIRRYNRGDSNWVVLGHAPDILHMTCHEYTKLNKEEPARSIMWKCVTNTDAYQQTTMHKCKRNCPGCKAEACTLTTLVHGHDVEIDEINGSALVFLMLFVIVISCICGTDDSSCDSSASGSLLIFALLSGGGSGNSECWNDD